MNGSEIDFYNSNACGIPLPGGIGRYRWEISAGVLLFTALAPDPCHRGDFLPDEQGWQKLP